MARTFLLGWIVAVLLVFVIADVSHGQINQGGQRIQNRGTTRYHSKSTTEADSFSVSTTRSPRNKNSRSETISDVTQHETRLKTPNESAVSSRTGANRHANLSIDNIRNRPKSHAQASRKEITRDNRHNDQGKISDSPETSKQQTASRRVSPEASIWADDSAKLNLEVFTKSSGYSRSRTGRKIYTNLNGQESRSHRAIPPRKSSSENIEKIESPKNESEEETRMKHSRMIENLLSKANASMKTDAKNANNFSNHKDETKGDIVLSGSESVRVDIPLTVGNDEDKNSNLLASTTISSINVLSSRQTPRPVKEKVEGNDIAKSSAKKSQQSDRSKSRTRSNANDSNSNAINLGSVSRRGTSKFAGTVPAEMSERSSRHRPGALKSTRSKSRNRSAHKSKATAIEAKSSNRSRITDLNSETNGRTEKRRTSSNDRRTSEGKRRSNDNRSKVTEIKTNEQDVRAQRGRSRPINGFDITTAYIPKATIAEATTVSSVATEMTTFSSASVTTRASTTIRTSSTERTFRNKGRDRGENTRLKKPPKEDFFNHGLGFRGRKNSTEGLSSTVANLKTTTVKSETQLRGNPGWTLRRRPSHVNYDTPSIPTSVNRDQVNEIILPNDSPTSTDTPSSNIKTGRRGTKRPKAKNESNTVSEIAAKDVTRGSKTFNKSENFGLSKKIELEESDNYPPAFRARLNQLKNSNLKPTEAKSTTRAHTQATKSSAATLFSERSKMKLDLARRLIKPELNIDENKYDVTTIPYSGKLKAKEITVSESRNVEKTTKANKIHGVRVLHESLTMNNEETEKSRARARWKFLESRKSLKDRNFEVSSGSPTIMPRKSRVITEKTTSSSVGGISTKSAIEFNTITRGITVSHHDTVSLEETTTTDAMKIRSPVSQNIAASKEEVANTVETIDNSIGTTVESIKLNETAIETSRLDITSTTNASESTNISTTEFPQEVTLSPSVTTFRSKHSSVMIITPEKVYPVYIPDAKKSSSEDKEKTKFSDDITKNTFRPRYTKQEQPDKVAVSMVTSKTVGPTSRYIRKKADVFTPYDAIPKSPSTELILTKRREFRPRTATYRRHSEMPSNQLIQQITKKETTDITITPKSTKYHAQIVTPNTRSVSSEPFVSVTIDTSNDTMPSIPDIAENNNSSSNSSSSSNIFNPIRNVFLNGNTTFLDQLRSTVAPLLNALSNKTPIFSSAYSNVDTGNLAPRITPNGSPPRFSARYKGAELFVRKPSIDQAVVPSITTSSTTASTLLENSGLAPPVDINSPGEPRFVTFYRALESASIRNENLGVDDVSQQQQTLTGGVTKVDSNAPVYNSASNDTANNNDTATIITTSSPDTTIDTTTVVQPANVSFSSKLDTENTPNGTLETVMMVETSTNMSGSITPSNVNVNLTTPVPISPRIFNNTITSALIDANVSSTFEPDIIGTVTTLISTNINETSSTLSSIESISSDIQFTEQPVNTNTEMMFIIETANADVLNSSQTTTESSITEIINNSIEDIETNIIQQSDSTISSQVTETTSTTEFTTTEEIPNDIIQTPPIPTTTLRTRLIDFAQDILSHLQNNLSTTVTIQEPISTTTYSESNTISDSSSTNIENPTTEMQETKTVQEVGLGNIMPTTIASQLNMETTDQNADIELVQTTTPITDGSMQEMNIQNILDLDTPDPSIEQRLSSNVNVEATLNSDSMTTTQDTSNLGNSSIDVEIATTTSMPSFVGFIMENDPSFNNDTLLTELMTIAKNLFSEVMNDTQQSSLVPNQINDFEATMTPDVSNLSRANSMIENENKNQITSSSDTSEKTTTSSIFPTSSENITERTNTVTSIDFPRNKAGENFNRVPIVKSKISLMEFNTRPTDVESSVDDVTTMPHMSLSHIKIETPNTITPVSMNFELITNISDSQSSNPTQPIDNNTERQTMLAIDSAQNQLTTLPNNDVEFTMDFTTNNSFVMNSVTANVTEMFVDLKETTDMSMENGLTTNVVITEIDLIEMNDANQVTGLTTIKPATDSTDDRFLVANVLNTTTMLPLMSDDNATDISDMTNTQLFNTEPPTTKSARNLVNSIETTTNQFNDITTNDPQMITNLISQTPNLIARFQDTTTATSTAQGTAGSSIIQPEQTTETITIPTTTASSIAPIISSTFPESFIIDTTTPSSSPTTPSPIKTMAATTRTTPMMTTTTAIPETTSIRLSSQTDLITTTGLIPEMTTTGLIPETTTSIIDINENLVSTEASMRGTTIVSNEVDDLNIISKMDVGEKISMTTTTMGTAVPITTTTPINTSAASTTTSTTQASISNGTMRFTPINIFNTMPFFGRFSNSQITPAPRPSSSSRAPVRDYLIYGIYPNKTIVRKRPEDNLIDPRNVDSPYVIFGIYPDGRLVRKFPNGTIIPDSPRNPVEVVFTLSTTTTTNRPAPRPFYNQANQAVTYNRYQAPVYYNNRRPVNELTRGGQNPSPIDFGLTGNAIGVPSGVGPIFAKPFGLPASAPNTNKMSDMLLNTQMGTLPNAASTISNIQMPNNIQSQNPIIQDRDISEASRTRITSDQHSSVYIGQNKFINYQIDSAPNVNPKVVDVRINSVATSVNEGTASIPSFENLLNNQSSSGVITAPPGFPWKDPLDQIFGITTSSPMRIASIASNQLDESEGNVSIMPRPINRQVEVFTPITSSTSSSLTTSTTPTVTNATTSTTKAASTTTAATTTTTTTMTTTTTTTTTTTSTTTPTTITTTTPSITSSTTPNTVRLATTASSIIAKVTPRSTSSTLSASDVLNGLQTNTKENVFGTTFNDLVFLNSLLQNNNVKTTTPKTLNEVEQMLANKILSLALAKPGSTRSPKAIQSASLNTNLNSIKDFPSSSPPSEPIIIDLLPHSTSNLDLISTPTTKKQLETSTSLTRSSILPVTTKAPVVITAKPKTTTRPKINITTQAPREFGMTLWRALFGGNFFDTTTAASIKQKPIIKTTSHKPIQITQKPIEITQKPMKSTTYTSHIMSAVPNKSHTTERSIQVSDIQVSSTASFADSIGSASASTPTSISSTTLLNNPNPRLENIPTSTYSPEDDAKFLATLLKAIQTQSQISKSTTTQRTITEDDEAFLRAILSQQSNVLSTTTTSSSTKVNPAALLALLLKQQGIEPPTPATNLREQLQLASLGLTTQSQSDPASITIQPSITTTKTTTTTKMKPIFSSTTQLTDGTTRKVIPKPSSRPRLQTTTWSPSSTYPPPLFGENSGSGLATATRVFGRFLGAAISNAAQQFQSLLRNGTINIG